MPRPPAPAVSEPCRQSPRHIAVIMDGNSRWARARHLPVAAGHRAGVEQVRSLLEVCGQLDIPYLTLFAFSSENWQRPRAEVNALMRLFQAYLKTEAARLRDNGICLRVIGDRSRFSPRLRDALQAAEAMTAEAGPRCLTLAADYGGQWDIVQAARRLAVQAAAGALAPEAIDAARFDAETCLAGLPKPDLCIRTGGDHRISNFLLWQLAYTELYFTDTFWPDFGEAEFRAALADYAGRQRRFGRRDAAEPAPC